MDTTQNSTYISLLKTAYLFSGLDDAVLARVVTFCSKETFGIGEIILAEGEESNGKAYVILSGSAEVIIDQKIVSILSPGMIFGEYALICTENRSATIRAIESMTCLVLDEDHLLRIANENNHLNKIMVERINENVEAGRGIFREE